MRFSKRFFWVLFLCVVTTLTITAQTTTFTYQGRLNDGAVVANGTYQIQFSLYDALSGGTQLGTTITNKSVTVTNGVFTVPLDFSPATPFATGADRWIEIAVRKAADPPGYTTLSPRQQITSSPYATRASSASSSDTAATATNATQLGGVAADQYVLTGDARLSDARPPTPGSPDYIQNQTAGTQASSNFTISGNGFINGSGGIGTTSNTFLGSPARFTVLQKQSGQWASHVATNNFAAGNSFGLLVDAGTNSSDDAFRLRSQDGSNQLFSVKGDGSVGVGTATPVADLDIVRSGAAASMRLKSGFGDSIFKIERANATSASAQLGFYTSGSVDWNVGTVNGILGGSNNNFFIQGSTAGALPFTIAKATGNVGIGTAVPGTTLDVQNSTSSVAFRLKSASGSSTIFLDRASAIAANSSQIAFNSAGTSDFAIGTSEGSAGNSDLSIYNYGTASNVFTISRSSGNIGIGTNSPGFMLHVGGETRTNLLSIDTFVSNSGGPTLCANISNNRVGLCTSSLRYKTNVHAYNDGLKIINRLQPVSFDWKENAMPDFGLAAEEVEKVDPQLVFYREGRVEGVRYDHIPVVLINAVKEQQEQIESQKSQIESQQKQAEEQKAEIEALKTAICEMNPVSTVCKK